MSYSLLYTPSLALVLSLSSALPVAAQESGAASAGTTATAPAATTAASAPATSPSALGNVDDFGQLDLEMATVSDFNQLDLEALLDAKVETASKSSESISRAPAIIEVLTRQQIYNLGARDLYTALTFLPGIELFESYSGTTQLVFRGMPQEAYNVKILMMVNGHPVFEPITSAFLMESIPLEAIKRIEVIRGPGSVLYGTNAFAGVINIITETQKEDGVTTLGRVEGGQFTTLGGGAGSFGRTGDLTWGVFAGGHRTRGYPYKIHKNQNEDCIGEKYGIPAERPYDCRRPGLSGALEYFNNYTNAFLDVGYAGARIQLGGVVQEKQKYGLLPNLRFNGTNEVTHYFGEASYRHAWEKAGFVVRAGWNHDEFTWNIGHFPFPSFAETRAEGDSDMYRAELTVSWNILESLLLDQGISYDTATLNKTHFLLDNDAIHSLAFSFDDISQNTASYYAQLKWDITEQLTAIGGFRASRFQSENTGVNISSTGIPSTETLQDDPIFIPSPRAGIIYAPSEKITFKALYGEAFRLPNLWETNATLNQVIAASPNLQPETIRTAEAGVDTRPLEWLNVRLNGYYSVIDDLIARRGAANDKEWAHLGLAGGIYDNILQSRIVGTEFSTLAVFNDQWSGFFNVSWKTVETEQIDAAVTGVTIAKQLRFARAAPFLFNIGTSYKPVSWLALRPNAQYVGPRGYAKAYTLVNAIVDVPITSSVTLSAICNNVFNTNYTYPEVVRRNVGTIPGGPGRAYYGRVTAEF